MSKNEEVSLKLCKWCGVEKHLSEFYSKRTNADGKHGKCKNCWIIAVEVRRKLVQEAARITKFEQIKDRVSNPDSILKICAKCKQTKNIADFSSSHLKGANSYCKKCFADYMAQKRKDATVIHSIPEKKRCTLCSRTKSIYDFGISKASKDAHTSRCLQCLRETRTGPEYRAKINNIAYTQKAKILVYSTRTRSRRLGIPHNLTPEDIVIPEFCPVLGIRLETGAGVKSDATATLDRINGSLGYVKGNVEIISWLANRLKSDCIDPEVFEKIAAHMRKNAARDISEDELFTEVA